MTNHQLKIERLIAELCPNGVEFKELGELGEFYGGLSGKSKDDFSNGNAKFVTYMNIFSNIAVNTDINTLVKVGNEENQNKIEYGDVLFTGSSETPDECGMSSVLTKKIDESLYLNSFCFGFRFHNTNLLLPEFSKYLFRDEQMRKQIAKTASGVTRFNISKKRFAKMIIPLPPLAIQEEIVKILNSFTELESELESELEARKRQYEYYREEMLTTVEGVKLFELRDIVNYSKTRIAAKELNIESYVGVDNLLQNRQGKTISSYVPKTGKLTRYEVGDILIGNIRPYLKKIWRATNVGGTNGDVLVIRINETEKNNLSSKFLYHLLASDGFFNYNMQTAKGAKMPRGNKIAIMKYKIPVPPFAEQERIVSILDKFDAFVNDISIGLPAELFARRSQYEYYRGKLLDFPIKKA
ncbi:MAG: restriction endonuclease subunit S [Candidatus Saccharimonadaceae bacterium]|nr:restriction endonuclease subunit S [Candidatus Saccharimonadaceae bacterium]